MLKVSIEDQNLPAIRIVGNAQGGVELIAEGTGDAGRFMTINPAGGHYEVTAHKSIPPGTGLELDADGYVLIHKD